MRERLIKIGARVIEHTARICIHLPPVAPSGRCSEPSPSLSCRAAHEPQGHVAPDARPSGQIDPNALHSEWHHTDPAGRIAAACPLNARLKTRHVMHYYG